MLSSHFGTTDQSNFEAKTLISVFEAPLDKDFVIEDNITADSPYGKGPVNGRNFYLP